MNSVCFAAPSYSYVKDTTIYLLTGSGNPKAIEGDAPKLGAILDTLIDEWYDETLFTSSIDEMRRSAALAQIINFADSAAPRVIREIEKQPSYLFLALEKIFGINPIENRDRGNIRAMCGAWVEWYQKTKPAFV
jgi:hypothetical protein